MNEFEKIRRGLLLIGLIALTLLAIANGLPYLLHKTFGDELNISKHILKKA